MITIQNPLTFTSSYPPKRLGAISDLLFFDIETTGFSGDYASVYLIGCVWHDGNTWILTQYFAEGCRRRGSRRFFCTSPDKAHPRPFQRRRV